MATIPPIILFPFAFLSLAQITNSACDFCHMHQYSTERKFEQKNTRYWEFRQESNTWVEVKLPYDLTSCTDDHCIVVSRIEGRHHRHQDGTTDGSDQVGNNDDVRKRQEEVISYPSLPVRRRVSLCKASESSVWVTGESGSIYERFWNGMQWVIAPHALPVSAGYAVSVFFVNQRFLALSEAGQLYQMQLNEESQPIWGEMVLAQIEGLDKETVENSRVFISSGIISNDRKRMYAYTKDGQLLELVEFEPPRWTNHGRPPGAKVASVTDATDIRRGLVFIVSCSGDLYEYDQASKPAWKKHIRQEGSEKDAARLASSNACSLHGLVGPNSVSLFFLTMGGELVERRLHQRKWKWVTHGNPKGHALTSITCNPDSLYVTTAAGFVFQYQLGKHPGGRISDENWVNHYHPPHARATRGISGFQLQPGRMIFPLDDGRLAELHLPGLGGEGQGPSPPLNTRRKSSAEYVWSILDAPESEGWNAAYCTQEQGPTNCMLGTKDKSGELPSSRRRKHGKTQQSYLMPRALDVSPSGSRKNDKGTEKLYRLRLIHEGKSFFIVANDGMTYECLISENVQLWLKHEYPWEMKGVLGTYNGSLFTVDENGSLLARERSGEDLMWVNCSSMRRGKAVIAGPPWDEIAGQERSARPEDAIFLVSKSGRLLEFTVALRNFKWKNCKSPPGVEVASIVDQEGLRENIIFVIGRNDRLYQYNKVTGLWHEHQQSQHLILSRSTGTPARRPSPLSFRGSLFLLSEDGGLVEYRWDPSNGWDWVEHGRPRANVGLVGAPGPCFMGTQLFLIGSDGNVYLRYLDGGEWKWEDLRFPSVSGQDYGEESYKEVRGIDHLCNPKVSSTRPIAFTEDSVIFELQDNRLAQMRHMENGSWVWLHTIATPTTLCSVKYQES